MDSRTPLPTFKGSKVSDRIHLHLYVLDKANKDRLLKPKTPFDVCHLLNDPSVLELLSSLEPGPKVNWPGLRGNLQRLKPYIINTPSGPVLLQYFRDLIGVQSKWLLVIARLEAFKAYDKQLHRFYIEQRVALEHKYANTPALARYIQESNEHMKARKAGLFEAERARLQISLDVEAVKLVTFKTSEEMWRNSGIMYEITRQYARTMILKKAALERQRQQTAQLEARRGGEESRKRDEIHQRNALVAQRQLGAVSDAMDQSLGVMLQDYLEQTVEMQVDQQEIGEQSRIVDGVIVAPGFVTYSPELHD